MVNSYYTQKYTHARWKSEIASEERVDFPTHHLASNAVYYNFYSTATTFTTLRPMSNWVGERRN